jgi:hypothetical protein
VERSDNPARLGAQIIYKKIVRKGDFYFAVQKMLCIFALKKRTKMPL